MGREKRIFSLFRARRRKDNQPEPDRRTAGAWFAQPPTDRGPCRARALDPPVRTMARPGFHRRRPARKRAPLLCSSAQWVAARYNPQLKSVRDKLVAVGKSKLIALVAVARKLHGSSLSSTRYCEIDAHCRAVIRTLRGSCGENSIRDFWRPVVFDAKLSEFELTFPDPI